MSSETITRNDLAEIIKKLGVLSTDRIVTGFGTAISLKAYNSASNMYTVPSDGLLKVEANWRANSYMLANICDSDGTIITNIEQTSNVSTNMVGNNVSFIPVIKGQKIYCQYSDVGYDYIWYIPYEYGLTDNQIDAIPDISYDSTADTYTGGLRDELYLTQDTITKWENIL